MGFSKYFMEQSDKMWAKGKDMIKYVLKRGGKMGANFQVRKISFRVLFKCRVNVMKNVMQCNARHILLIKRKG